MRCFVLSVLLLSIFGISPALTQIIKEERGSKPVQDLNKTIFDKVSIKTICNNKEIDRVILLERMLVSQGYSITKIAASRSPGKTGEDVLIQSFQEDDRLRADLWRWIKYDSITNKYVTINESLRNQVNPEDEYFKKRSGKYIYEIGCQTQENDSASNAVNKQISEFAEAVKIRGTVSDLAGEVGSKLNLQEVSSATWKYTDDLLKDKKTSAIEGVIGVSFNNLIARDEGDSGWPEITPFLYMKHSWSDPKSSTNSEIELFQPGIAIADRLDLLGGRISLRTQFEASKIFDEGQGATEWLGGVRIEPSFVIFEGSNKPRLFQDRINNTFPMFNVLPRLALIAREHLIEDSGRNPFFQQIDNYANVGYEATLLLFLNTGIEAFDSLRLSANYLELHDIHGDLDIRRQTFGVTYSLPGSANKVTVGVEYSDGRDMNTLQDENKLVSNIGVRF